MIESNDKPLEIKITKEMVAAGTKVLEEYGPLEGCCERSPLHAGVVREILQEALRLAVVVPFSYRHVASISGNGYTPERIREDHSRFPGV